MLPINYICTENSNMLTTKVSYLGNFFNEQQLSNMQQQKLLFSVLITQGYSLTMP